MGDAFQGKVGLKHDEPLACDVLTFYDNNLTCTSQDLIKKWFKHMIPMPALLCEEDFVLLSLGLTGMIIIYKERQMIIYKKGECMERGQYDGGTCLVSDLRRS